MSGPFAESSIVMEFETGSPEEFIQFEPSHLPHDDWLHRRENLDSRASVAAVIDAYALPESESYQVRIVEVPPGEQMQIGDLAGTDNRTGGADLVRLLSRDSLPTDWVRETVPLATLLD